MGIIIGILIGLCCGSACEIIAYNLLKTEKKRKWKEEERIRTLEHELSFLNNKCDNTQKACRLLSEEVKRLNKIIEKEIPSATPEESHQEKDDSIPLTNDGFSYNEPLSEPLQDIASSIHNALRQIRNNENLTSQNLTSMMNCYNANVVRNMALMQSCCSVSTEEAQRRIFHALYPGWRLPDED